MKEELSHVKLVYERQYAELKSLYDRDQLELENLRQQLAKQPSLEQLLSQFQNDPMSMVKMITPFPSIFPLAMADFTLSSDLSLDVNSPVSVSTKNASPKIFFTSAANLLSSLHSLQAVKI